FEFVTLRTTRIADGVSEVAEEDHPIHSMGIDQREEVFAAVGGVARKRNAVPAERGFESCMVIRDTQNALAAGTDHRRRFAGHRLDPLLSVPAVASCHQIGVNASSPDS